MKFLFNKKILFVVGLFLAGYLSYRLFSPEPRVDFSTDVKPILNKKCITCHGGVKAKAGFSVLFREEALDTTESGKPAIIPGDPDGSEMIRRITLKDPEDRMPYKHEPLSKSEINILRRWIKQGAKWGEHWAYIPVKETPVPTVNDQWVRNDVDRFILQKLDEVKLKPSKQADKATLLRRVSLDLIGMYPSDALAQQYLKTDDDKSYELLVDSLLASPHFGERWASLWLDLSRYADTKGYESDGGRSIWKFRDWLIKALNDDKPYNRFITEMIAGDLLPDATDDQYIATGFSRSSMTNDEGGTDNEEFRKSAVLDRVNTTWEALMGTTFSCVQCHSHPYDPFHHDEYYKFMAYFNNTRDEDVPSEYPLLRIYEDSLKDDLHAVINYVSQHGGSRLAKQTELFLKTWQPAISFTTADSMKNAVLTGKNSSLAMRNHAVARLKNVDLQDAGRLIWNFYSNEKNGTLRLRMDSATGPVFAIIPIKAMDQWRREAFEFAPQQGVHDVYVTYDSPSFPVETERQAIYFDWFAFLPQFPGKGSPDYAAMKNKFWKLLTANVVTTPVMVENPATMWRKTNVFERGTFRTLGKEVEPAVPQSLGFAMPANAPRNRLGLAMWLTDKRNPLVSRTMVNRLWEQVFGNGIAETLEDLGTQGIPPTHKELLDNLSWNLMNNYQWSIKKLLKELVMSATYRQDSRLTDELKEKDLANKYYARGPRVRLSAEQLRDQDLCISGVVSSKMYGPGVMPWQPDGIWLSPYNGARWQNSKGEDQYRRAVYTYWKRTSPYPSMISFDGVQRVLCTARRIRTNTPLQALVTLNDSAYLDMARLFAYRIKKEAGDDINKQLAKGYELMTYKSLPEEKAKVFISLYNEAKQEFQTDAVKTRQLIGVDSAAYNNPSTAALVVVANAMMNLDEVVMKN
jgi:hypothetical protein